MDNTNKVLKIIFDDPLKEFHLRLLGRLTKLSTSTVSYIINDLAKKRIVIKEKNNDLRLTIVKANTSSEIYKFKKKFYNLEKIYGSGLIEYINKELSYPTIILFGSWAKAENHKDSDIDLFIIADGKKKLNPEEYEKKLGAELQIFAHTKKEFQELKMKNKELINNVVNGYVLSGFLEVL